MTTTPDKDQAARAAEREARKAFTPWDFRQSLRGMKLTLTQYRVAIELAEHAEVGKPAVWPSLATLAGNCACNQRMVEKSLADLTAMGIIAKGKGRSTRILIIQTGAKPSPRTVSKPSPRTVKPSPRTVETVSTDG